MRILMMMPAAEGVYPPHAEERRRSVMRSYSNEATTVDVDYMPEKSGFVPWGGQGGPLPDDALARANELSARRAEQAEREGYDAFCPYGLLDIGVQVARTRVKIPVVGQAEAAMLHCGLLGRRFASCSYMPGGEERIKQQAADLGVGHLFVGSTAIGIPNSEYPDHPQALKDNFARCCEEAKGMGAEMMGYVAMSICPGGFSARELSAAAGGFPVLDALACQIATAEWWHRTGLPPALWKPAPRV